MTTTIPLEHLHVTLYVKDDGSRDYFVTTFPKFIRVDDLLLEALLAGYSPFAHIYGNRLVMKARNGIGVYVLEELPDRPAWKGTRVSHNA